MRIDAIWWGDSSTQYISSNEKVRVGKLCAAELQINSVWEFAWIERKMPLSVTAPFYPIFILSSHIKYEVGTPTK